MRRPAAPALLALALSLPGLAHAGDPSTLANLVAWHKASGVTAADGASVASIPDSSGNGNAATQATSANQPTYHATRSWANNRPSLRFSSPTTQYMLTNVPAVAAGQPYTCFATFYLYPITGDTSAEVVGTTNWNIVDRIGLSLDPPGFATDYANALGEPKGDAPVPLTFAFVCDGTNSQIYCCGVAVTKSPPNAFSPALAAGSTYSSATTANAATMDFLECAWYSRALSSTEIATLQAYTTATYYPATGVAASFTTPNGATGVANSTMTVAASPSFTMSGVGTIYGSISVASTVVTPADGASGTFSPTTATLTNAAPTATMSYTPASAGPKTITPANDASLATTTAYYGATTTGTVTRAYNDSGVLRSPYNHRDAGTYYESNNPGSYIRTTFGGTSISETFDFTAYTAVSQAAGDYPTVVWRVDGGSGGLGWQRQQLTSSNTTFSYATGLSAGTTHTVERFFAAINPASITGNTLDRWTTPVAALRSTGFVLDAGFTLSLPSGRPKNAMFISDSLGEGWCVLSPSNQAAAYQDASVAWPQLVAKGLNAECGQVCFAGTDYHLGSNTTPASDLNWPLYSAGHSRLTGGLLTPTPDYLIVSLGTNGNGSANTMIYGYNMLKALRVAAPTAAIFVVQPYGLSTNGLPYSQSVNAAMVAQYQADNPTDTKVYLIQGDRAPSGLTIHYGTADHQRFASSVVAAINSATASTAPAYLRPRRPQF